MGKSSELTCDPFAPLKGALLRCLLVIPFVVLNSCGSDDNKPDCSKANIIISVANSKTPSQCDQQDGSVTLMATGGQEPYLYKLNTGSTFVSQSSSNFVNLFAGNLEVEVTDNLNCKQNFSFELRLAAPSGISFSSQVKPIIDSRCNLSLCHDGSLGAQRDWRSLAVIKTKLNNFQRILSLGKMPPPPNEPLSDI